MEPGQRVSRLTFELTQRVRMLAVASAAASTANWSLADPNDECQPQGLAMAARPYV
jgi:hypothetical protein